MSIGHERATITTARNRQVWVSALVLESDRGLELVDVLGEIRGLRSI
jgi:hypothetical protein